MWSVKTIRTVAGVVAMLFIAPRGAAALESRTIDVGGDNYRVVVLDLTQDSLELYWRDASGEPYRNIDTLKRKAATDQRDLLFATNAGMYDHEYRPLGLTVADGKVLRPLNPARGGGAGNFGLQPNGIFYLDGQGEAGVIATSAWSAQHIDARIATQSGPMLVIDGAVNPGFLENSDSRKWRSGVCAETPTRVVFAVSETPVTFYAFAELFRDKIGCRDALYLDGTLSQIYTAADGYAGAPDVMVKPYAGMLAVFSSKPASR